MFDFLFKAVSSSGFLYFATLLLFVSMFVCVFILEQLRVALVFCDRF